ncbi:hypothetical protein pdam_00021244, partial [Pocillopora damicornis]
LFDDYHTIKSVKKSGKTLLSLEIDSILRSEPKGVERRIQNASEIDKEDIETWTSRQIEYLLRRRAAFKGVVTKNSKKAKDIISEKGSRTVLRTVKERVFQALKDASKTTQDRAESEEWLDNLQSEVKDIVGSIEEVFRKPWR